MERPRDPSVVDKQINKIDIQIARIEVAQRFLNRGLAIVLATEVTSALALTAIAIVSQEMPEGRNLVAATSLLAVGNLAVIIVASTRDFISAFDVMQLKWRKQSLQRTIQHPHFGNYFST